MSSVRNSGELSRYTTINTDAVISSTVRASSSITGSVFYAPTVYGVAVSGSTVSGSTLYAGTAGLRAATYSGSALALRGVTILEGFKVTGSVTAGDVLVISSNSDDYLSGSKQNLPTTIVGVAAEDAANNAAVRVIVGGVTTLYASGAITRGELVGSAGLSGSNYVAVTTDVATILGRALASAATNASVRVLIQPA